MTSSSGVIVCRNTFSQTLANKCKLEASASLGCFSIRWLLLREHRRLDNMLQVSQLVLARGAYEEGLKLAQDALALYRSRKLTNPPNFSVRALSQMVMANWQLQRWPEALKACEEERSLYPGTWLSICASVRHFNLFLLVCIVCSVASLSAQSRNQAQSWPLYRTHHGFAQSHQDGQLFDVERSARLQASQFHGRSRVREGRSAHKAVRLLQRVEKVDKSFKKCKACASVYYCSSEHQKLHWKASHKEDCKRIQKELQNLKGSSTNICEPAIATEAATEQSQSQSQQEIKEQEPQQTQEVNNDQTQHVADDIDVTKTEQPVCAYCHQSAPKLQKCGGCKVVWYCSAEHQKLHWKAEGGHKADCRASK